MQIHSIQGDFLCSSLYRAASLAIKRHEDRIACIAPVKSPCKVAFCLWKFNLYAECAYIGLYSLCRAPFGCIFKRKSSVGSLIEVIQTGRKHYLLQTRMVQAWSELRKPCTPDCEQQGSGLPVSEVRSFFIQSAVGDSVYRHTIYALVRRVLCCPLSNIVSVFMIRLLHTEVDAVGRLYIISHIDLCSLYRRSWNERYPAVQRKVLFIEVRRGHLSQICPMWIALSAKCVLRPCPVSHCTVSIISISELVAVVAELEIGIGMTAIQIKFQLCVSKLLLEVLLRRIHCKGELDNILAVLHIKRSFLCLQPCTCEGDQLRSSMLVLHT